MTHFYSKYIYLEELIAELHSLELSEEEKHHLAALVDSSLHHAIMDEILSNLKEHDKKLFLKLITEDSEHDKIMSFLNEKVENIEIKIKKISDDLVKEMHEDVKEAKKIKNAE